MYVQHLDKFLDGSDNQVVKLLNSDLCVLRAIEFERLCEEILLDYVNKYQLADLLIEQRISFADINALQKFNWLQLLSVPSTMGIDRSKLVANKIAHMLQYIKDNDLSKFINNCQLFKILYEAEFDFKTFKEKNPILYGSKEFWGYIRTDPMLLSALNKGLTERHENNLMFYLRSPTFQERLFSALLELTDGQAGIYFNYDTYISNGLRSQVAFNKLLSAKINPSSEGKTARYQM